MVMFKEKTSEKFKKASNYITGIPNRKEV